MTKMTEGMIEVQAPLGAIERAMQAMAQEASDLNERDIASQSPGICRPTIGLLNSI
ncbi:MAG: hypothetical protein ACP5QA_16125 [Phycisphaerae bacterium]